MSVTIVPCVALVPGDHFLVYIAVTWITPLPYPPFHSHLPPLPLPFLPHTQVLDVRTDNTTPDFVEAVPVR